MTSVFSLATSRRLAGAIEALVWVSVCVAALAVGFPFALVMWVFIIAGRHVAAIAYWAGRLAAPGLLGQADRISVADWARPDGVTRVVDFVADDGFLDMQHPSAQVAVVAIPVVTVLVLAKFGCPRLRVGRAVVRRAMLLLLIVSFAAWLGWAIVVGAADLFWRYANVYIHTDAEGRRRQPMVAYGWLQLVVVCWGGVLGYLLTIAVAGCWLVQRSIDRDLWTAARNRDSRGALAVLWSRCVRCGYEAAGDRPCPECGVENPLVGLRRVYFGRWHARLMLSRWRWVAVLPWVAVVVLFFWPLISGVARHWLA